MLFSKEATKDLLGEDIAITCIACLLKLIGGGWKATSMNIPE